MKTSKILFRIGSIFIFVCCLQTTTSAFADDTKTTFAQIRKAIPIGTAITNAVQIMKRHGFKCSIKHGDFLDGSNVVKNVDFIYCDKQTGWIIQHRYQAVLVFTNDAVSDIKFSTGLIGP